MPNQQLRTTETVSWVDNQVDNTELFLVAYETPFHCFWVGQCDLPGNTKEKMEKLRRWHARRLRGRHSLMTHLLFKKPGVAIGTLEVWALLDARYPFDSR